MILICVIFEFMFVDILTVLSQPGTIGNNIIAWLYYAIIVKQIYLDPAAVYNIIVCDIDMFLHQCYKKHKSGNCMKYLFLLRHNF